MCTAICFFLGPTEVFSSSELLFVREQCMVVDNRLHVTIILREGNTRVLSMPRDLDASANAW